MQFGDKIFVTESRSMLGSAIIRMLHNKDYKNIISNEFDLYDENEVDNFFCQEKPDYVFLAAGLSGGISANQKYPADFFINNIKIEINVINSAFRYGVKRLLYLASSCCYPSACTQPIKEEYFMAGPMEQTSESYSMAKAAGISMCAAYNKQHNTFFIPVIPSNIYGPCDDFSFENSHVLSALIAKFHHAKLEGEKKVTLWGSGKPLREFIYVDDAAEACIAIISGSKEAELINIAANEEMSISELAGKIGRIAGFNGEIDYDLTKPDGTFRKKLDGAKLSALGWKAGTAIDDGIVLTYEWYKNYLKHF